MESNIQEQNNEPTKSSKNILIIISAVIISSVIAGVIVYFWQNSKVISLKKESLNVQRSLQKQITTLEEANNKLQTKLNTTEEKEISESIQSSKNKEFKMLYYASNVITAEIPETWSIYKNPENFGVDELPDSPTASIGKDDVSFGDMNRGQIDLFYAINNISNKLIEKAKETKYGTWGKETVGGIEADVVTYPLDNGKVTKGGTGGKRYFLSLPDIYDVRTLVIWKQARGDEKFENGFEHFIETLKFKKN